MATTNNGVLVTSLSVDGTAVDATSPLPVSTSPTAATTAVTARVGLDESSTTLKALNAARRGLAIYNKSTANLYVKLGATANIGVGTESYAVRLIADAYYEVPAGYTGVVDGIWDAADATGAALVTELSA